MSAFPGPDATREEIAAWLRERAQEHNDAVQEGNALYARNMREIAEAAHEAPPMANGPSPVCSACEVVRIDIRNGAFCRTCKALLPVEDK